MDVYVIFFTESGLAVAENVTRILYEQTAESLIDLTGADITELSRNLVTMNETLEPGMTVLDLVVKVGSFKTKGENNSKKGVCDVMFLLHTYYLCLPLIYVTLYNRIIH